MLLPLWTSVLVRTYAWMVLLGRNGVFNRWLIEAGVISDPLPLLHNFNGVLIGMVHVLLPYMVLPIYGAVRRLDPALVAAAEGLGASNWRIFWRIYLPLTLPGIFAGAVIVFVLSLGFYITPALLGGGKVMMVAVMIEQEVRQTLNWPFAAALSAVLLALTLGVYTVAQRLHPAGGAAMSRRALVVACAAIYLFLMLPLLVVFPISLSSAPYMQFPPPGFSYAVVRALSRRSAMDRCHGPLALYRRRHGGARPGAGRAARLQPGARQVHRPRAARSRRPRAADRADHHPVGRPSTACSPS